MTLSQSSVLNLYLGVVEDVIAGVRECFLDEGVDEQILQELKQTWENKLHSSKALEQSNDNLDHIRLRGGKAQALPKKVETADGNQLYSDDRPEKLFPVQITLPAQQNSGETGQRVLTIQVPESAIAGNQLQTVLTGPLIGATLALPTALATSLLQQHVTAALRGQQAGNLIAARPYNNQTPGNPNQFDGSTDDDPDVTWNIVTNPMLEAGCSNFGSHTTQSNKSSTKAKRLKEMVQVDGGMDSSEEEDDDDDDDDEDIDGDDVDGDEDEAEGEEGAEEEPLNSGDDVSEEDASELFDTDNVVVCQYDKITRSRNKWKFYLKDGVMNLQGRDYVFQKSTGDAEW